MANYDIIIIGGGHNGLVTACYLAKAGLKALVLERREIIGGAAVTEEIHPGFRCSTLAHTAAPFSSQIAKGLRLAEHGLDILTPPARVLALVPDGRALCIHNDTAQTVREIEKFSSRDAQNYPEFERSFRRIGKMLAPLLTMTPPAIENPSPGELWNLGKLGRSFRRLGKKDAYRLLRWGPMAVADLVAEWFETETLRATIAARGIFGAFAGPWSAGTSTGLLWQAATDGHAISPSAFVRGGMGALAEALASAARSLGVEIRTGVTVEKIEAREGKASKVLLETGEEISARAIVSNADPRTTFLKLIDPIDLDPSFLLKIRNYRATGVSAKINLALSGLPSFTGVDGEDAVKTKLSGRIHIGPDIDYLERAFDAAKYGDYSPQSYLDIQIPSLLDATLAPAGAHVMSVYVQYAPYKLKEGDWNSRREGFADNVINVLAGYAPNLKDLIVARQVITPLDLEQTYGLSGGHIHHGEQSLDQVFTFRPLLGWAQYRTPIKGLYLCGAGTHPGGGVTGGPGANAAREIIKDFKRGGI
ncbi:MAG TPA: NAD(P)/FAD-dependent oxidoreductase [Pyrinomonadaceae bacterium]|jgi:phytoene dehydrogenase-like protein|nr:NAD(P)/FAD-dependent oxidoreductase [Pyrinomonadaceae bacterium]